MNNKKNGFWSKLLGKTAETNNINDNISIKEKNNTIAKSFIPNQEEETLKQNTASIFENPIPIIEKIENNYKITAIAIFDENNKLLIRTGINENGEELKSVDDLKKHLSRPINGCKIKFLTEKDPYTWIEEKEINKIN